MKISLHILLFLLLFLGHMSYAQCEISEDFDSYQNNEEPIDWTLINTTGETNNIYARVQPSNQAPTPPKFLRIFNGNAATGELIFVAPQVAATSDGNHRLKFWLQGTPDSSLLQIGTVDTNDETGTFSLIISLNPTNDWVYYEVVIPEGTNQYLAFKHDLATTWDQINIDSICFEEIPTCLEVTDVTLSNPTMTTIDVSWNESGSGEDNWEYVVQEVGGGTPVSSGTAHTSTDTTPVITVTDLDLNTEYEVYVRANCGSGDFGAWILAAETIRTDCGPLIENFCEDWAGYDDGALPFCWTMIDDSITGGHVYLDYEYSGYNKNMLEMFFTTNTVLGDIVAISPDTSYAMDGTHRLKFTAGSSTDAPDVLEVGTINPAGVFVLITTISPTSNREKEYYVSLPDNDHTNFAFRHNGTVNKYIWINTVCIENTPTCLEVIDVNATNVQFDSADINWTVSGSSETTWEYIIQEPTVAAPDAATNGTETMANMVNVPLEQNTTYIAYVRAKCDTDDFGVWIVSEEFTTTCDEVIGVYNDSFEGLNESGQEIKPCWNVLDNTSGDFRTYASQNNILPTEGNLMLRMFFSSSSDAEGLILSSPETTDISTDKQIRFKMNKSTATTEEFSVIVGTMSDPLNASTFVALDDTTVNNTSIDAETWTEFTINFSNYDTSLNHTYIAFKPQHSGIGSNFKYVYMDEYVYEFSDEDLGFNDEVVAAELITISDDYLCNDTTTGIFTGATRSDEFPCENPAYSEYKDIWYRIAPTESGRYVFNVDSVNGEPISMYVFGGSTADLIPLSVGCSSNLVSLDLEDNGTYFIAVASEISEAQFVLCVSKLAETPLNDEPSGAVSLTESTDDACDNATEGFLSASTNSVDADCGISTSDVWYTFTATETTNYTFKSTVTVGTSLVYLSVYSGTPGNLTQITNQCDTYLQNVDLTANEMYYISLSSSTVNTHLYFDVCVYQSPPAPANDECSGAFTLNVGEDFDTSFIVGNSTSSTRNTNDPIVICEILEFEEKGKDIWFNVTVPASGNLTLETRSNSDPYLDDMGLQAYSGTCNALTTIFCSNDQGEGFFNYIELEDFEPGTTILVRAWGYAGRYGYFKIAAYDNTLTCEIPLNGEAIDVTETTAVISWDEPAIEPGGYEYIVQNQEAVYPTGELGTVLFDTETILNDLTPETDYAVWVRSLCDENGSAWHGPILFTTDEKLGTDTFNNNSFTVYPNPAKDILTIESDYLIDTIIAYNMLGQKVQKYNLNTTKGQINIAELSTGIYLFEVNSSSEKVNIKVVIK
ncbi:fibronectin type III domain-containing protein [Patiriisocius marinus]|uniref:fibronectin type III domain-containing protein n=1 Tax=Patiriisocius marinus TaxID=1397112 RepID=UPI00232B2C73|nr:T9SS type A sorting domain-containing protein [Patiriisocius marinus]